MAASSLTFTLHRVVVIDGEGVLLVVFTSALQKEDPLRQPRTTSVCSFVLSCHKEAQNERVAETNSGRMNRVSAQNEHVCANLKYTKKDRTSATGDCRQRNKFSCCYNFMNSW